MLKLRKGAASSVMPREVWFALGIAHAYHSLYNVPDMVVTDFSKGMISPGSPDHWLNTVKLRTRDIREFDASHWCGVLQRHLEPMGFTVERDAQHLIIEFRTALAARVHAVEERTQVHNGGNT